MNLCQRPLLFLPLLLVAALLSLYTWKPHRNRPNIGGYTKSETSALRWHESTDSLHHIQNRTLGFQEIRVISLPERTDKHDAWAVTASVTGFDYSLVDGVDSTKISDKALPYTMNRRKKIVACWRAHMDVLQDIVRRGVTSTLVFEDDADWDVSIRSQLVQFARGSRWLLDNDTFSRSKLDLTHSPYGEGWDFLWLGYCDGHPRSEDPRRFVIPHDPTVVPITMRSEEEHVHFKAWENVSPPDLQTRFVTTMRDAYCTAGYAISLQGARKALYHMSMLPYDAPVDWGYSGMCQDQKSGFTCISPFPRIIGAHRPAGAISRWSDIETSKDEVGEAHSEGLMFSTRMNLDRLLVGQTKMQSPTEASEITGLSEMDIDEIGKAVGHEEKIELKSPD